jgi:hypothetical protein
VASDHAAGVDQHTCNFWGAYDRAIGGGAVVGTKCGAITTDLFEPSAEV